MTGTDSGFSALPGSGRNGSRRTGVEIEFAGLTETETADIVADMLGGRIVADGPHAMRVEDTRIGRIKVELDTALRNKDLPLLETGLDLARAVVPVEIVSDPLDLDGLALLDTLRDRLRQAGAQGSRDGLFLGFGVHLNPETPVRPAQTLRIVRAFALLEDWLRATDPIDTTRRLLPFVDPWPRKLTDALVAHDDPEMASLMRLYAGHTSSRNHGLDLLPAFKDADPETFAEAFPGDSATSGRPAFHYRLPDCRIDEVGWTLGHAWQGWARVERVAEDPDRLARLGDAWIAYRRQVFASRSGWAERVSDLIGEKPGIQA